MTKLGDATKGSAAAVKASALAAALSGAQHFEDVAITLPNGTVIAGRLTTVGVARALDIEGEVIRAMSARSIEQTDLTQGEYELERAIRLLAEAVRDPADPSSPLGTLEDWGRIPLESITDAYRALQDMRERMDPAATPLTDDERAAISSAISKKNSTLLRYFGVRRLSSYMLTSVDPPASSVAPTSSDGASSSEP